MQTAAAHNSATEITGTPQPRHSDTPSERSDAPRSHTPRRAPGKHARTGKVARLPKKTRDALCQMIQDGIPYPQILAQLGDSAKGVSTHCISEWKKGGYQDWLEEQRWMTEMSLLRDGASDLLADCDQLKLHQAAIQLAVIQIFQSLKQEKLNNDPQNYTRMLNALSRLSREALVFAKYQELERPTEEDDDEYDPEADLRDRLSRAHEALLSQLRPLQRSSPPAAPKSQEHAASTPASEISNAKSEITEASLPAQENPLILAVQAQL